MSVNPPRSIFVNVLAWIFIALSGFGTLMAIAQNFMIRLMLSDPEFKAAMHAPAPGTPPFAGFMAEHAQWFFVAFLLMSALMLVSSIGLLRRWNWARLCFIGLMVVAIVWQLAGLGIQYAVFSSFPTQLPAHAAQGGPDMAPFFMAIGVVSAIFALGVSVLFGWIIMKLLSPAIAAEFRR